MSSRGNILDRVIQNRVLLHVLFWTCFLLIFTLLAVLNTGFSRAHLIEHFVSYMVILPVQMMAGYLLVYYQVPRLLLKRKYLRFIFSFLISIYLFSVLARLATIYIAEPFFRNNLAQESLAEVLADPLHLALVYFPGVYVVVFLMLAFKVVKDRFEEKHQLEVLQKEKASAELKFLKAQIHPHFLFNTLNNLYALTLTKSDLAPKVVLKLSDMLDFMLYQCNVPTILVEKEHDLIQDYVDLEALRYGKVLDVSFNYQSDDPEAEIAPLILLSFIENAFKHGISKDVVDSRLAIDLVVEEDELRFGLENTKPRSKEVILNINEKQGIGLSNVERQLELNYKNRHQLAIDETEDLYTIDLKIDLRIHEN